MINNVPNSSPISQGCNASQLDGITLHEDTEMASEQVIRQVQQSITPENYDNNSDDIYWTGWNNDAHSTASR